MGEIEISEIIFSFKLTSLIGRKVVKDRFSGRNLQFVIGLIFNLTRLELESNFLG